MESNLKIIKRHSRYKHGMGSQKQRNPLYQKWSGMKRRCLNKNDKAYARYGGAGVTISDEWMDFMNFYKDMGPTFKKGLSLDRIDNNKGYSRENCRWVTLDQQGKNKRTVPMYKFRGVKRTASDWDKKLGFKVGTFRTRIKYYGWSVEEAVTKPKIQPKGFFKDNRGLYRVEFRKNGKRYFVGRFKSVKEAIMAKGRFLAELLK